ncbi:ATP-dependent DNA ligase [Streptomyces paromomycinus]|uniref:DNA ligase C2 n=1 Tax=Streptomyces paromomycinus TaxID=92743 RepID=A0A401VXX5_STREY|nr:ATP-dependent DNA ligase [Streptomyces paromomycinus]GCD41885.1 DNA ligase C2 [Streptomyces paromomycinus]
MRDFVPILAEPVTELPPVGKYGFEAKWDGFRCILERAADGTVHLQSRQGTALTVAFSDIAEAAQRDFPEEVLLDGEVVIWHGGRLDFGRLQRRLNRRLATVRREIAQSPAHFVAFDLLRRAGEDLTERTYRRRRDGLEALFEEWHLTPPWTLCPVTYDRQEARRWMQEWAAAGIEGIVAKNVRQPYRPGVRGWIKVRTRHTAEAITGAITGTLDCPASVLLARLDERQNLRFVGRSVPLARQLSREMGAQLLPAASGHPWRGRVFSAGWGSRETLRVTLVAPELVVEVSGDTAVDAGRWRHPVRVQRLRSDMTTSDVALFGSGNGPSAG